VRSPARTEQLFADQTGAEYSGVADSDHEARAGANAPALCFNERSFPPNHAVDALGEFSIDEGGIFLAFLIHSAALCSAARGCSIGHALVGRVLARVICYLHWLILVSRQGYDRRLSRWSQALVLFPVALFRVVEQYDWESVLMLE